MVTMAILGNFYLSKSYRSQSIDSQHKSIEWFLYKHVPTEKNF